MDFIVNCLHILVWFLVPLSIGISASSILQALGKGIFSLLLIIIRKILVVLLFVLLFVFVFHWKSEGVYLGIVVGNMVGSVIAYLIIEIYLQRLKKYFV